MSVAFTNIVSALDTPKSLIPFFVKDSFDITGRTVMANNEGGKHEAREKFIEEAGTSLFWIGGIPAVRAIINHLYKNKFDTAIHFKRINSVGIQNYFADELKENGVNKFSKEDLEGIVLKGKKLEDVKLKLSQSGYKPNISKGAYPKYHVGMSAAAVAINLFMLVVAVPKFNQYLSRKIISKETNKSTKDNNDMFVTNPNQQNQTNPAKNPSFGSTKDLLNFKDLFNFTKIAEKAQLNVTSSMLLLDYGISGSRITFIPRDNNERIEYVVKEGGIILFYYYAADLIKKGFEAAAKKFNVPINLDYKILSDKKLTDELNSLSKDELFKFVDKPDELNIIKFIDKELAKANKNTPKDSVFDNFTLKMAQKSDLIDVEYDDELQRWIRNSKKYIETEKVADLNSSLKGFYEKILEYGKGKISKETIENVLSKTKKVKAASILGNIAICCASLSYFLPKIQYTIREHRTNTKRAPGIKVYQDLAESNQLKV